MKNLFTTMFLLSMVNVAFSQYNDMANATVAGQYKKSLTGSNAVDPQWQVKAERYIADMEYYFKTNDDSKTFYAANSRQRLAFSINGLGYTVSPLTVPGKE